MRDSSTIGAVRARAYTVPTDAPEAGLIARTLGPEFEGHDAFDIARSHAVHRDLSGHCAPALRLPVAIAAPRFRHLDWFHDHIRIERMFVDGAPVPRAGRIAPDLSRPGHGLALKMEDVERYAA